jgi:hypothetical protein
MLNKSFRKTGMSPSKYRQPMLKDVYSTHMKTEAKDEQAKNEMIGTVTQTISDEGMDRVRNRV